MMTGKPTATDLLDREYLQIRCRILDIAAALDRIDRADGADSTGSDPRFARLLEASRALTDGRPDRTERVQMIFSDAYDPDWRNTR